MSEIASGYAQSPDLSGKRYIFAWMALALISALVATFVSLLHFPTPQGATVLSSAQFSDGRTAWQDIALPYSWARTLSTGEDTAIYRLRFDGEDTPQRPLFIFIPAVRQKVSLYLNGIPVHVSENDRWTALRSGYYHVSPIPDELILRGENILEVRQVRADGWSTGYLSNVYLATQDELLPYVQIYDFILEQSFYISIALRLIIAPGILMIFILRRHDEFYRAWVIFGAMSLGVGALQSSLFVPFADTRPYILILQVAIGLLANVIALAASGKKCPRSLYVAIAILPLTLLAMVMFDVLPGPLIVFIAGVLTIGAFFAASIILGDHFARRLDWATAVLAIPFALTGWFGVHDICLALGLMTGDFMLTPFSRLLVLFAIMSVLTGRLAQSLNSLDAAHATLQQSLKMQKHELNQLYTEKSERNAQKTLERERDRLMRDLHDGISGHLVSILAHSEKDAVDDEAIQSTAREALDDLRLVVQSLDLGEGDLRVALAGFRERLEPRLRRQGCVLDWSMERLPEVAGMSPGHGLAILRILQEAVTNALRHGFGQKVLIHAEPAVDGGALIMIENDLPSEANMDDGLAGKCAAVGGYGLANMRHRAEGLGGDVRFKICGRSAVLELFLPKILRKDDD